MTPLGRSAPLAPLLSYLRRRYPEAFMQVSSSREDSMIRPDPWVLCGVPVSSWQRFAAQGYVPIESAEAIGLNLAGHPARIWSDWPELVEIELCWWCEHAMTLRHIPLGKQCAEQLDAVRDFYAGNRLAKTSERVRAMTEVELAAFLGIDLHTEMPAKSHGCSPSDPHASSVSVVSDDLSEKEVA